MKRTTPSESVCVAHGTCRAVRYQRYGEGDADAGGERDEGENTKTLGEHSMPGGVI